VPDTGVEKITCSGYSAGLRLTTGISFFVPEKCVQTGETGLFPGLVRKYEFKSGGNREISRVSSHSVVKRSTGSERLLKVITRITL